MCLQMRKIGKALIGYYFKNCLKSKKKIVIRKNVNRAHSLVNRFEEVGGEGHLEPPLCGTISVLL